jgi:hypothetical protein
MGTLKISYILLKHHPAINTSNELPRKLIGKCSCVWIINCWQMLDLPEYDFTAGDKQLGNRQ